MKTTRIAVETHNRKIRRLRKIFECLKEYTHTDSEIADKYYTHVGDAAQQEAVMAVSGMVTGLSLKERVKQAVFLLDAGLDPSQKLMDKVRSILKD